MSNDSISTGPTEISNSNYKYYYTLFPGDKLNFPEGGYKEGFDNEIEALGRPAKLDADIAYQIHAILQEANKKNIPLASMQNSILDSFEKGYKSTESIDRLLMGDIVSSVQEKLDTKEASKQNDIPAPIVFHDINKELGDDILFYNTADTPIDHYLGIDGYIKFPLGIRVTIDLKGNSTKINSGDSKSDIIINVDRGYNSFERFLPEEERENSKEFDELLDELTDKIIRIYEEKLAKTKQIKPSLKKDNPEETAGAIRTDSKKVLLDKLKKWKKDREAKDKS